MKNMVRNSIAFLLCVSATVSAALAAVAPVEEGSSLLVILFVGFFALIIVLQLVPACLLFISLLKGLFSQKTESKEKPLTYK